MGKEGSRMETWPQHQTQDMQTSGKTEKRVEWEDEINKFLPTLSQWLTRFLLV